MSLEEVIKTIQVNYSFLSSSCIHELYNLIQIRSLTKNEIFVKEGQFAKNNIYRSLKIINSSIQKKVAYKHRKNGKNESIVSFK